MNSTVTFEPGPGGLRHARVSTPLAETEVYLQGAHVARWTPAGQKPVLFMSSKSFFAPGKAIRGGVPVIFPWFGGRSDGKPGPAHGFARAKDWKCLSSEVLPGGEASFVFELEADDASRELGFDHFSARFTVTAGATLEMALEVSNRGAEPLKFEAALHTYFTISDIANIAISGLEGTSYIDKTDGFARKVQPGEPIRIAKETDQVHENTEAACVIADAGWGREITVAKTGSLSTVVWNPWIARTASMADMAPEEWHAFVCVETANAGDNAVMLAPGADHAMTVSISLR